MSSNAERSNIKILRNLKRLFTWAHNRNLCHETFSSLVKNLKTFCRKSTGSVFSLQHPKGYSFILRNLFRFFTKLKKVSWQRFRLCAQVKNLFKFCRIFYCFFRHLNSFGSFFHLPNLFGEFGKRSLFLECTAEQNVNNIFSLDK